MPRGGGYTTLPDDGNEEEIVGTNPQQEGEVVNTAVEPTTSLARGTGEPLVAEARGVGVEATAEETSADGSGGKTGGDTGVASKNGKSTKEKRHGGKGVKQDLMGLPTTEGVYVGSPVTTEQQQYSIPRMPASVPVHTRATVLATQPESASHVLGQSQPPYNPDAVRVAVTGGSAGGAEGQRTVIVVNTRNSGAPWELWDRVPQQFVCPACSFTGYSRVVQDPCSPAPLLAAACCCLVGLWPCSFIPFLVPDLRDSVHRCPSCNLAVGRSRQCF